MTEIGEAAMMGLITEHTSKCELCSEPEKPPKRKSNVDANWEEDPGEAIGNDSGDLENAMAAEGSPRPKHWVINGKIGGAQFDNHVVKPNPHHLIPGNESLKRSNILDWIFESDKIKADIGYDVNNEGNGIWLPSNNAMRRNAVPPPPTSWANDNVKTDYVVKAMDKAQGHFHDRHTDYSKFVKKILNKIAERMDGVKVLNMGCPYENTKSDDDDRYDPPYWLYVRLNGVSKRLSKHLSADAPRQDFLFTSKLVKRYWKKKNTKYLEAPARFT
ncbi:MAG: AHH domain-containing protein [Planctomycetota bacterium]|jgi:hypothetical protein